MPEIIDQMNRKVVVAEKPQRIISLVPSQTELLHYLGLENEVVGITKFCIHPKEWFTSKTRIGGTKNLDIPLIQSLKPDLIIGNKEENVKEQIETIAVNFPTYMSDVNSYQDALKMIQDLGNLFEKAEMAESLTRKIDLGFNKIPSFNKRILYFMWNNPYMVAGRNTFIGQLLEKIGFENAWTDSNGRYKEISAEEILHLKPDICLLSTEPFPFKEEHIHSFTMMNLKAAIVDGEMFSWYGSRMALMPNYFTKLHQELTILSKSE